MNEMKENSTATHETLGEGSNQKSIYVLLEEDIMVSELSEAEKNKKLSKLLRLKSKKVNIMMVGSTGSGKSSTVNALFNMNMAKVGVGVNPETSDIIKYELENLIIWDTPGLGDSAEHDKQTTRSMVELLNTNDEDGNLLIDMVVVVMDASSKDMATAYTLIKNVLVPCLGDEAEKRILIGLNQSDIAMKGYHWNDEKNEPDEVLAEFLETKAISVQRRIEEETGLRLAPVCYCAGYTDETAEQRKPYNLTKLLYHIVKMIPKEKRFALADHINDDENHWYYDDQDYNYRAATKRSFLVAITDCMLECAETGSEIGKELLGIPGSAVGGVIGGAVGLIGGIFGAIVS